jgi:YHS domain-containing protein
MKKMIVWALLLAFVMPLAAAKTFAADEAAQAGIVDVGNTKCPVMGGPVNGKDFVVYEGMRYGLCCPGCDKTFLSDPAKYIAKVNAERTAATPDAVKSEQMEKDMEQGSL